MSNFALGFNNKATAAKGSLSGGSWEPTAPLTLLLSRPVGKVAQTTDDSAASTTCTFTFLADESVHLVGWAGHNLMPGDGIRVRLYNASSVLLYDSGVVAVWGSAIADEDAEAMQADWGLLLPAAYTVRSVRLDFDISNTGNTATDVVRGGRLFLGDAWQPEFNFRWGVSVGVEDPSTLTTAVSGAEFSNDLQKYLVAKFETPEMTESQAMLYALKIQRMAGITGEVFLIYDPEDTTYKGLRDMLGRLRSLSGISHATVHQWASAWEIKQYQ